MTADSNNVTQFELHSSTQWMKIDNKLTAHTSYKSIEMSLAAMVEGIGNPSNKTKMDKK